MSDSPSQSNSEEENIPEKKDSGSLFDLPPIPEEARKKPPPKEDSQGEETEVLELVPVLEAELATDENTPHQYTIIGGDGDEYGPQSIDDVLRWIRTGRANAQTLVRTNKSSQWQPLEKIPALSAMLEGAKLPARKPGQATAISALTLAGGLIALVWTVVVALIGISSSIFVCCFIPSGLYSLISGTLITIQGVYLFGKNARTHLPRTGTSASLQICGVFAFNPICLILGIITHVLLRNDEVVAYIKSTSPNPKG